MAELSYSELLVLNNILGFNIDFAQGMSVFDLIAKIESNIKGYSGSTMSCAEIQDFVTAAKNCVKNNPSFGNYTIADVSPRMKGEAAPIVTFVNGNDAVVVFWGTTGKDEWYDNVKAAGNAFMQDADDIEKGSFYQEKASEYVRKISEKYDNITVTGHSKGGNKAQYVAIMCPEVDRCVSFDGQGFSVDFIEEYSELIAQRKDIITSISADNDVVNALLPSIAGTRLYVDTSEVPKEYISQFFYYHKPNILLNTDGQLYNTDNVPPSKLAVFINDFTKYMSNIEDDAQREAAIEFLANTIKNGISPKNGDFDFNLIMAEINNLDNTEGLAILLAYTFEFAEERNLSYEEVLDIISGVGIKTENLNNPYIVLLWEALFDASRSVSADEFVSLCNQIKAWGQKNGITEWNGDNGFLQYILEDPVRIIELYSYLDVDKKTVNKAIGSFFSEENIAKLIGAFATDHPLIASVGAVALTTPALRIPIEMLTSTVAAIGVVALVANHIVKNWDKICDTVGKTIDYVKDKISEFYNDTVNNLKNGFKNWLESVCLKTEKLITKGKRVLNGIVDGVRDFLGGFKKQTVSSFKYFISASNSLFYIIASKAYRTINEPVRINIWNLSDCVDRMNRLANRVASIDRRLDDLYWRLAQNNVEQDEGVFTSLANIYNLFRADLNVDEGESIRRKARALSDLFDGYENTEKWVLNNIPRKL